MSQLTYNFNPAIGVAGMVGESQEGTLILSKIAGGNVTIGLLCSPGSTAEVGMDPINASPTSTTPGTVITYPGHATFTDDPMLGSQFVGVPVYDSSRPPMNASNQYIAGEYIPVLRRGCIWVPVVEAITQFGDVYVWNNPGGGDPAIGTFAAGSHTGKAVKFPFGRWLTSTTTDQTSLALLEIRVG